VCDHARADQEDHCTISLKGVMRMRADATPEFVALSRWKEENKYFGKLIKVCRFKLIKVHGFKLIKVRRLSHKGAWI